MTDYERYQLLRMIDCGTSLQDLMKELTELQHDDPEDADRASAPVSELFGEWAAGSGIWMSEAEWREHEDADRQNLAIEDGVLLRYDGPRRDVTIPEGVTGIGRDAFANYGGLTGVSIPGSVAWIGPFAFAGCTRLTRVAIPKGVTRISGYAFAECRRLKNVTIPEGAVKIGRGAFTGCTDLTAASIPESVTKISPMAFAHCPRLTIHAPVGSRAEKYAKANGIRFRLST